MNHRPLIVALAIYLTSWTALTAMGAVIFAILPAQLWGFLFSTKPLPHAILGGADYWAMLILPYLILPVFALATYWATRAAVSDALQQLHLDIRSGPIFVVMLVASAYCFYKLRATGHLNLAFLRSSSDYAKNLDGRIAAINDLHFLFYCVVYSVLPMTGCLFLSRWLKDRSVVDLLGLAFNTVIFAYLVLAIYMKSPFVIYVGLLAIAAMLTIKIRWRYVVAFGAAAIAVYVGAQALQGTSDSRLKVIPALEAALASAPRNVAYRMASAYPFYIDAEATGGQRCGEETNNLPFLPKPRCDMAAVIFSEMYPSITAVQGMAPAAAHVYDFAAVGTWAAVITLIVAGITLGTLSAIASLFDGILGVGVTIASCAYAYYLTQVPLLGAISYSHGVVFFLAPLVLLGAWSVAMRRLLVRGEIIHT